MTKLTKAELADITEDYETATITQMYLEQKQAGDPLNKEQKLQVKEYVAELKARDKVAKAKARELAKQVRAVSKELKMDVDDVMDLLAEII